MALLVQVLADEVYEPEAAGDADQEEVEQGAAKGVLGHLGFLITKGWGFIIRCVFYAKPKAQG